MKFIVASNMLCQLEDILDTVIHSSMSGDKVVTFFAEESMWPTRGRRKHELIHIHMICCRCPLIGVGPHCPHLLGDTLQYLVPHYPGLVFHTGDMGECISHTFSWWHKWYVLKVKKLIHACIFWSSCGVQ